MAADREGKRVGRQKKDGFRRRRENAINAEGCTQSEAWAHACDQAASVGMLAAPGQETKAMTTPSAASPSLEQRIAALEADNHDLRRQLNRLRLGGAVLALGMILYAGWHALFIGAVRATVVEAQRVIVRDPAGRVRLVLGTDDSLPDSFRAKDNPSVLLFDEQGALRGQRNATDDAAGLRLFDPDGRPRVMLTHGKVTSGVGLKDRQGAIRAALALDASGPRLDILDEDQRPEFRKP
jgi:hypothetical protein